MTKSTDSFPIIVDSVDSCGEAYDVRTSHGYVSVTVYGDRDKPALITYPDIGLNHASCFRGLFSYPEASSLLLHNFCIFHISPPGHQASSPAISSDGPVPSVEDLADQILVVLNYFGIDSVMCMGATAGAYILTLFALRHKERVLGLILISPLCRAPSWIEWFLNKVVSNLLYFSGMSDLVKECLIQRYFSKEARGGSEVPESDAVRTCRKLLDYVEGVNVMRLLQVINRRCNITSGVKKLKCRTIIFVGEHSPFYSEAVHMASTMDGRRSALVEVKGCGSMVSEEQPHTMLIPMEYFLMGYGLHRPHEVMESPTSPLCPLLISPHLLSPESMGLKLKPIRTRPSSSA